MFDLAGAVLAQRDALAAVQPRLRQLNSLVNWPQDLTPLDWSLFYALILDFKPDRIVELGRGHGNSTAVFSQAANDLPGCRVVSVDRDRGHTWESQTLPALREAIDDAWLRPLDLVQADILNVPAGRLFGDSKRVVLFWDAHGEALGRYILAALLPALRQREHIIILHDVVDSRYASLRRAYMGDDGELTHWHGHYVCTFEELNGALDFTSRNDIEVETPAHAFDSWLNQHSASEAAEMRSCFRDVLSEPYLENGFMGGGHWLYFDLASRSSTLPLEFPPAPRRNLLRRSLSRALASPAVDSLVWRISRARTSLRHD